MIPSIWAAVSRGSQASISPATPADKRRGHASASHADPKRSCGTAKALAATMSVPGAATSGLLRWSRVGPCCW